MQTVSTVFEREVVKMIAERKKNLIEIMTSGVAIQTMDSYREYVGRLSELDEVLQMFDEANTNISKQR
jgi:hypothetical protein